MDCTLFTLKDKGQMLVGVFLSSGEAAVVILTMAAETVAHWESSVAVRGPCLTGSHSNSPYAVSDCPLSPVPPLSTSLSPCHTHTHTAFHQPSHDRVLQQLSPSATSVPCPLREDDVFDGQNHCNVYLPCLPSS